MFSTSQDCVDKAIRVAAELTALRRAELAGESLNTQSIELNLQHETSSLNAKLSCIVKVNIESFDFH